MASIVRRLTISVHSRPSRAVDIDKDSVILKGYLKKKGHIRRNWLSRFFILCPGGLLYYKDEAAAESDSSKPLGCVAMFGCTVKEDMFQRHENVFSIFTAEGKDYHLQTTNGEEMKKWIAAIEKARDLSVELRLQSGDSAHFQRSQSDVGDFRLKKRPLTSTSSLPGMVTSAVDGKEPLDDDLTKETS